MIVNFSEDQRKLLHGHYPEIANRCGCTKQYVYKVLNGKRNADSDLSKSVVKAARDIIRFKKNFSKAS